MTKMQGIMFVVAVQLSIAELYAQDPVFSHFYANGLQLNPALAGVEGPGRVYIGYRNQWPNSGSSYITYQASYDQYVEKLNGGIGVRILNDRQGEGTFNAYNLDVMYAYQFRASRRWSFAGAIQSGVGQRSFNPSTLLFGDMIDPVTGGSSGIASEDIIGYNKIYPDFAAGIAAFRENFYGGAAVHHLLRPLVTDSNDSTAIASGTVYRRYTAHLGMMIPVIDKSRGVEIMKLSPNLVFIQQQGVHQINYGMDLIYKDLLVGVWTRHDIGFNYGNLVFTTGYGAGNLRFRYSYDVKLSSPTIRLPNMGAHEISLVIMLENHTIRKKGNTIICPKI